MSPKHTSRTAKRSVQPHILVLGVLCVLTSFSLGIKTAGDVQTIAPSEAGGMHITGDMDEDGRLTVHDAINILEIAQGYKEATPEQLMADPNGDGQLTVDDAVRLLHDIAAF
jgi:hypothetical protein